MSLVSITLCKRQWQCFEESSSLATEGSSFLEVNSYLIFVIFSTYATNSTKQHELYNVQCWNIIHITHTHTHTLFLRYLICDICDKYHVYEYLWQISGMGKNLQELWIAFQVSKPAGQMSLSSSLFCYNTEQQFRFMIFKLLDMITRFNYISEIFELYVLVFTFLILPVTLKSCPRMMIMYLWCIIIPQTGVTWRSLGPLQLHQSGKRISGVFDQIHSVWLSLL